MTRRKKKGTINGRKSQVTETKKLGCKHCGEPKTVTVEVSTVVCSKCVAEFYWGTVLSDSLIARAIEIKKNGGDWRVELLDDNEEKSDEPVDVAA